MSSPLALLKLFVKIYICSLFINLYSMCHCLDDFILPNQNDVSTYSNFNEVSQRHLNLNLTIDFENQM